MKKVISFILAVAMICSVITMPVSAQSEGSATPDFRDSFKKDASLYSEKEASVFTQNRTDTTYHEILNAMWVGFGYTQKASFSGSNQTVHFFDLTNGGYQVLETGKKTGSRAKTIDTNGTISYEKGADEQYDVNYYKYGDYKLGPVSVEDDDATIEEDDATEDDAEEDDATEDDAEVNGDVIDTPVVEDDDANPGTGVALAVVPAMVAAAAVVLSKKRK